MCSRTLSHPITAPHLTNSIQWRYRFTAEALQANWPQGLLPTHTRGCAEQKYPHTPSVRLTWSGPLRSDRKGSPGLMQSQKSSPAPEELKLQSTRLGNASGKGPGDKYSILCDGPSHNVATLPARRLSNHWLKFTNERGFVPGKCYLWTHIIFPCHKILFFSGRGFFPSI